MYEAHADLHDATVDGNGEKTEGSLECELFGGRCRGLAQDIFSQVAHNYQQEKKKKKKRLEKQVADVHQETGSDKRPDQRGGEQLQKEPHVQVAVTRQVEGAAEVSDDEPDAVRAVSHGGGKPEKNHQWKAQC